MTKVQIVEGPLLSDQARDGLCGVLDRAAELFKGDNEGVVLMDEAAALSLALPPSVPKAGAGTHVVLDMPRAMGWTVSYLSAWMTFSHPMRPSVHVAVHPWMDVNKVGWIYDENLRTMAANLRRFAQLVGVSFRATPGVAAMALLRRCPTLPKGTRAPLWQLDVHRLPETLSEAGEAEIEWSALSLSRGKPLARFDQNFAYLGAAAQVEVGLSALMPQRWVAAVTDPEQLKGYGGYIQIVRPKWPHPYMPDPLGTRLGDKPGSLIWVTVPTLKLLLKLADETVIAPVDIRAAFLSQSGRLFRSWAETIRDALYGTVRTGKEAAIHEAVKEVYRKGIGMLGRPGGRVYRPDWRHAIVAHSRTMLWAKAWRVGQHMGVWPVRVHHDEVAYPAEAVEPEAFPLMVGSKLGQFKLKI